MSKEVVDSKPEVLNGFKIVNCRHEISSGGLSSITRWSTKGYTLYKIGKWVSPNTDCGPLAVFETGEHVACFINDHKWDEPLKCHRVQIWTCSWVESNINQLFHPIDGRKNYTTPNVLGTRFADKVMLHENVTNRFSVFTTIDFEQKYRYDKI